MLNQQPTRHNRRQAQQTVDPQPTKGMIRNSVRTGGYDPEAARQQVLDLREDIDNQLVRRGRIERPQRASRPPIADVEAYDDEMTTHYQSPTPVRQRASQPPVQPARTRQTEPPMRRTPITEDPRRQATRQQQPAPSEPQISRRQLFGLAKGAGIGLGIVGGLVGAGAAETYAHSFLQNKILDPFSQRNDREAYIPIVTGLNGDSAAHPTIFHAFLAEGCAYFLVIAASDPRRATLARTQPLQDIGYKGNPDHPILHIHPQYDAAHRVSAVVLEIQGGAANIVWQRQTISQVFSFSAKTKAYEPQGNADMNWK